MNLSDSYDTISIVLSKEIERNAQSEEHGPPLLFAIRGSSPCWVRFYMMLN